MATRNGSARWNGDGQDRFHELAERAKASCAVSRALGGVEQINLSASLAAVPTRE
jgi:organic hydroperoxide reductase OsmC/OhrA